MIGNSCEVNTYLGTFPDYITGGSYHCGTSSLRCDEITCHDTVHLSSPSDDAGLGISIIWKCHFLRKERHIRSSEFRFAFTLRIGIW